MVRHMLFMRKFAEEERLKLLNQSMYHIFEEGHAVFHQGDQGDFMYIILKGSIGVRIKDTLYGQEPLFITTLREGDNFGEIALLANKPDKKEENPEGHRRRASCICLEQSHLLALPTRVVNETVQELLTTKLKDDIQFFLNVHYFSV